MYAQVLIPFGSKSRTVRPGKPIPNYFLQEGFQLEFFSPPLIVRARAERECVLSFLPRAEIGRLAQPRGFLVMLLCNPN